MPTTEQLALLALCKTPGLNWHLIAREAQRPGGPVASSPRSGTWSRSRWARRHHPTSTRRSGTRSCYQKTTSGSPRNVFVMKLMKKNP
jgi:hypothetical protein